MKLRPLNDKVIIKPSKAEEKTKSGLFIPEVAQEKQTEGEVIAVGPGKVNENTGARNTIDLKVGDKVRVMETRPLSRLKRWRVISIVERAIA
jgi:chaperonin GroES